MTRPEPPDTPESSEPPEPGDNQIRRLRTWRSGKEPDLSLGFIGKMFEKQIARPHKKMGKLIELWEQHIPADLASRTALHSYSRGVLRVDVADSATLYQLDRMLRSGAEQQIRQSFTGSLRTIKLKLGPPDLFQTDIDNPGPTE